MYADNGREYAVSGTKMKAKMKQTPERAVNSQYQDRHPSASLMYDDAMVKLELRSSSNEEKSWNVRLR
jgi:hypothetical protein